VISSKPVYGIGPTLLSAGVMSLAIIGDALIYVILPVNAALFGVTIFWVGVLLAANRIIRIFTLGAIASLAQRTSPRNLAIAAAATSTVSTLIYGLGDGQAILLVGRVLWGLSFATLTLVIFSYAVADRAKAGTNVGWSRAIHSIGPALVLLLGPWAALEVGPKNIFIVLGVITSLSLPLALLLPKEGRKPPPRKTRWFPKPKKFDFFLMTIGLTVDGIFAVAITLTVAQTSSIGTAMITGGILIGLRRTLEAFLSPIGGILGDKYRADRLLLISTITLAIGFILLALGHAYTGGTLVVAARAFIAALWPAEIARRTQDEETIHRLAVGQTWRDVGAAAGPLMLGSVLAVISLNEIYWMTVVLVLISIIFQRR
jgi:DHA1 family inner membrane transport protein